MMKWLFFYLGFPFFLNAQAASKDAHILQIFELVVEADSLDLQKLYLNNRMKLSDFEDVFINDKLQGDRVPWTYVTYNQGYIMEIMKTPKLYVGAKENWTFSETTGWKTKPEIRKILKTKNIILYQVKFSIDYNLYVFNTANGYKILNVNHLNL